MESSSALDLLLELPFHPPQGIAYADSMLFWSQLALFSLELVSREQFVPTVQKSRAFWKAVIDEPDQGGLNIFSRSLPPSCRGLSPLPSLPLEKAAMATPSCMVHSFVNSAVNATVHSSLDGVSLLPARRGRRPKNVPLPIQFLTAITGEMPQTIEEAFSDCGISLFPEKCADLKTDCSCPDWSNPCKHIAAVYYLLAEQFDRDPFLIFKLRGKSREKIVEALRSFRSDGAEEESKNHSGSVPVSISFIEDKARPLEECLDCFWQKGSELDLLEINPRSPSVENAVLKILGDDPISIGRDNLAVLLKKAYGIAGRAALRKAARGIED